MQKQKKMDPVGGVHAGSASLDLPMVRQREELKELIKEANEKEEQDETGSFMYRVRRPPWMWRIKKIARNK